MQQNILAGNAPAIVNAPAMVNTPAMNVKFVPTPALLNENFNINFEKSSYKFKFRDFVQDDFFGKPIENVCKNIAIRAFEQIISSKQPPLNWIGSYSSSSTPRSGNIMIPSNLFEDIICKVTSLTVGEEGNMLDSHIQTRINMGFNDKIRRSRQSVKKLAPEYNEGVGYDQNQIMQQQSGLVGNEGVGYDQNQIMQQQPGLGEFSEEEESTNEFEFDHEE
uniref:Uncharacterized protein n=1 Tax=Panagrolaimus sp. ES5 TaxID=591445 RepID=A0AC34FWP0_9BILA